jgi:putative transposase
MLLSNQIYHVYNRGNNRQPIFFNRENHLYFLRKMRTHLSPSCDFLAYCLMPNHFHFLVKIKDDVQSGGTVGTEQSRGTTGEPGTEQSRGTTGEPSTEQSRGTTASRATTGEPGSQFSKGLKIMLSSYTRAIQKQQNISGSLFQQNTKHKQVSSEWSWEDYTLTCFRYILQNPVSAGLVTHPADWEFSSYRDLVGLRNGTLCNPDLIKLELSLEINALEDIIGIPLKPEEIEKIW